MKYLKCFTLACWFWASKLVDLQFWLMVLMIRMMIKIKMIYASCKILNIVFFVFVKFLLVVQDNFYIFVFAIARYNLNLSCRFFLCIFFHGIFFSYFLAIILFVTLVRYKSISYIWCNLTKNTIFVCELIKHKRKISIFSYVRFWSRDFGLIWFDSQRKSVWLWLTKSKKWILYSLIWFCL